jgi:hypothetical protein
MIIYYRLIIGISVHLEGTKFNHQNPTKGTKFNHQNLLEYEVYRILSIQKKTEKGARSFEHANQDNNKQLYRQLSRTRTSAMMTTCLLAPNCSTGPFNKKLAAAAAVAVLPQSLTC